MLYELFIALRYLRSKQRERFISVISLISVTGVALGVAALIIVLAVMNGFEHDLKHKILGNKAHLYVLGPGGSAIPGYQSLLDALKETNIIAAAPFIEGQVILSTKYGTKGIVVRGIEPKLESKVTILSSQITDGAMDFDGRGILVGRELARELGLNLGDEVNVFSPRERDLLLDESTPALAMVPQVDKFKVVGIFASGMYEYDSSLGYVSLKDAQNLFHLPEAVSGIAVKISNIYQASEIASQIEKVLKGPYWVRTWQETNRNLFSALKLEKTVMFILLVLIVCVAAFNIASTLIMIVMEKTREIGILKSMGSKAKSIMAIFMFEGLAIGLVGVIIGLLGGMAGCELLRQYQFVKLPSDVYYISTLPVQIDYLDVFIIVVAALGLSALSTLYPAWAAARLDPVKALRYE